MNLNELSNKIYQANKSKGFWDAERNKGELLMLVTSELSEALDADRESRYADILSFNLSILNGDPFQHAFKSNIKDTFEDEIADAVIRLLDLAGGLGIDIDFHVNQKLQYNATRPNKHGKKY